MVSDEIRIQDSPAFISHEWTADDSNDLHRDDPNLVRDIDFNIGNAPRTAQPSCNYAKI